MGQNLSNGNHSRFFLVILLGMCCCVALVLLLVHLSAAGASVFKHIGLSAYSARTFFRQQKCFIFPEVLCYWDMYRTALMEKMKGLKNNSICGDGHFESMGHSAKYGAYILSAATYQKLFTSNLFRYHALSAYPRCN